MSPLPHALFGGRGVGVKNRLVGNAMATVRKHVREIETMNCQRTRCSLLIKLLVEVLVMKIIGRFLQVALLGVCVFP